MGPLQTYPKRRDASNGYPLRNTHLSNLCSRRSSCFDCAWPSSVSYRSSAVNVQDLRPSCLRHRSEILPMRVQLQSYALEKHTSFITGRSAVLAIFRSRVGQPSCSLETQSRQGTVPLSTGRIISSVGTEVKRNPFAFSPQTLHTDIHRAGKDCRSRNRDTQKRKKPGQRDRAFWCPFSLRD